jgi:hypothetical protein
MKTIQKILQNLGNPSYCKINNDPFMPLVIESIGEGPHGFSAVSVCHYGEQNGDLMRDPEMCFEISNNGEWYPYYFRNDYLHVEQEVYFKDDQGRSLMLPKLKRELEQFARQWSKNLKQQGFVEAAKTAMLRA